MPLLRKESKRRLTVEGLERDAIVAGLHGRPCPAGGSTFRHWAAEFPSRRSPAWMRIEAVFRSLPHAERQAIIARRRRLRGALGEAELCRAHREWLHERAVR